MSNSVPSLSTQRSALRTRKHDVVLLDAQGTLLKPHPSTAGIYAAVCRRCGVRAPTKEVALVLRDLWTELALPSLTRDGPHDTSEQETREWWAAFNTRVFRQLGMQEGLESFLETLWDTFGSPESWRLFPEVGGVLGELRRRGYRLGIVSNWDSRLLRLCDSLGLSPFMEFIVVSAAVGVEKPDRRIFEIALARAGVCRERAIHVGDDYEADVLGARGAGLDAMLINRGGAVSPETPAIRSLEELLQILP